MGIEGSEDEETEGKNGNGDVIKIIKGKGKERAEDRNVDGRRDGNECGDGNGGEDRKTL